uniref:Uncharacterized protein n=1 Tax=Columba livia TaxID=8932 RepID=R7VVN2_COLLI
MAVLAVTLRRVVCSSRHRMSCGDNAVTWGQWWVGDVGRTWGGGHGGGEREKNMGVENVGMENVGMENMRRA